ncbi:MAG: FAD-binding oxidoreductase [Chloroflexota bacterium]|nr:FAD-binding oxidoreductase [Chloroflexota bacterium]
MTDDYPYNGRLSRWDEVASGLAIVGVQPEQEPFAFEPGQYATLGLANAEGKLIQRPMSISSSADDLTEYEFFIRLVEGGAFTTLLWERTLGDPINIKGPKGRFLLQDDGRAALFVASGTGLAPFMSMLDTLRDRGQTREIVLLHGVSYEHDLAWREELEQLDASDFQFCYVSTLSRPQQSPGWQGLIGRVETIVADQLDACDLTPEGATLYLCGNPEMIVAVDEIAQARGFDPEQVRKELYWPKGRSHGVPVGSGATVADDEVEEPEP